MNVYLIEGSSDDEATMQQTNKNGIELPQWVDFKNCIQLSIKIVDFNHPKVISTNKAAESYSLLK